MGVPLLTIETYNEEELKANCQVSFTEIMAFATTTFNLFAFPATVSREQELARYIDWNNSTSNYQYFKPNFFVRGPSVETSFTRAEMESMGHVSDHVAAFTERRYGRAMRPISSLLSQMGLFRAILALQEKSDRPLTVFEIGPGNCYLGALLLEAGLSYIGFDNAQSLYLWQNRLLIECAGEEFFEWAESGPPAAGTQYRAQHLPWWHYLQLRHQCSVRADIIVSNTNLGEMNYGALQYTMRISRQILEGSPVSAFLFTNIGDAKQNSMATVEGELKAGGFKRVCDDLLYAYVPSDVNPSSTLRGLNSRIPLYNPDGSTARYATRQALKVTDDTLPMDMDFISFVGTFSLPRS